LIQYQNNSIYFHQLRIFHKPTVSENSNPSSQGSPFPSPKPGSAYYTHTHSLLDQQTPPSNCQPVIQLYNRERNHVPLPDDDASECGGKVAELWDITGSTRQSSKNN